MKTQHKSSRSAEPVARRAWSRATESPAFLLLVASVVAVSLVLSCSGARKIKPATAQDQFERAKSRFDASRFLEATE